MLSDERMEKTFKETGEWLLSAHDFVAPEAEDVAAYDAAKARAEESFPASIAERLIAGENPIKVFREYRELTQEQLAEKADTTAPYVSQIETGRRTGSVRLLHRMADALGVSLDDLA
jgi:DNA-binding XRE family transcriptional regulator